MPLVQHIFLNPKSQQTLGRQQLKLDVQVSCNTLPKRFFKKATLLFLFLVGHFGSGRCLPLLLLIVLFGRLFLQIDKLFWSQQIQTKLFVSCILLFLGFPINTIIIVVGSSQGT
jgi:hypothetical protein